MGSLEQAVYAILIAFVIGVILCPILIPVLHKMKFGQNVRDDGPQTHLQKQGTPTMGGIAFLIAFVLASVPPQCRRHSPSKRRMMPPRRQSKL